jgi:deoxyribodipyrimidine photo-lyase
MNIWWIRRDLRLEDNQALTAALEEGADVLPVFILDEQIFLNPNYSEKRVNFLLAGLHALDEDLRRLGSGLIIRRGDPVVEIPKLAAECGVENVFAEEDVSPYSIRQDTAVVQQDDLHLVEGLGVHPTSAITGTNGKPYTIFTPFSRKWKALPFSNKTIPAPTVLPPIPEIPSDALPDSIKSDLFPAGEHEAKRRLTSFMNGPIFDYKDGRNQLGHDGTSVLSPYFRFGMLSARQAIAAAFNAGHLTSEAQSREGCENWINEIIWREFYQSILYHFPLVLKEAFRPSMRNIDWRNSPEDLQAWKSGQTGYPVVDAGMRQLAITGWMHNRARMITASFLVKHLLINWQEGEQWFMNSLIDGDPASNNGSWQWTAGTGTDAAPYFRIFNPVLQGKRFDQEGLYVHRWVPELANVPTKFIHTPWMMTNTEQRDSKVIIGSDYPAPIVEHNFARQRAMATYSEKKDFPNSMHTL